MEHKSVKGVSGVFDIGRKASSEGKDIFGKARQDFRSVVSICESCRSSEKERVCLSFVILFRTRELQKEAGL